MFKASSLLLSPSDRLEEFESRVNKALCVKYMLQDVTAPFDDTKLSKSSDENIQRVIEQ